MKAEEPHRGSTISSCDRVFLYVIWLPDFTPLFNWNTKQLFVYLEAEYTNGQGVSNLLPGSIDVMPLEIPSSNWSFLEVNNTVVLWDRIVQRKEDAMIDVVQKDKYKLRDLSGSFR